MRRQAPGDGRGIAEATGRRIDPPQPLTSKGGLGRLRPCVRRASDYHPGRGSRIGRDRMAKAKGAKKKAAAKTKAKAKPKVKAKAKKAVAAKPAADSGLAKRVADLEAALASLKKASGGKNDSDAISKAIDIAATEIRQRAEDSDHVAMAEVRKHVDKVQAELVEADERLHSEIGAVAAQGDLKQDDLQVLRRRIDVIEERLAAKK